MFTFRLSSVRQDHATSAQSDKSIAILPPVIDTCRNSELCPVKNKQAVSWIEEVSYQNSTGVLRRLYDRIKGPEDYIDNILTVHSLRPHTLQGHMALYKSVLHHRQNSIPKWMLETLGVYVSLLNNCDYCVEHHFAGLRRLLNNDHRAHAIRRYLEGHADQENPISAAEVKALEYARKLTESPQTMREQDVAMLRNAGHDDGAILEINQVCSYFNYVNRTVLGLGVNTHGDILGLSPGDNEDPENWRHG